MDESDERVGDDDQSGGTETDAAETDAAESDEQSDEALRAEEFRARLAELLRRAHRGEVTFDRAWTFRDRDGDSPDLMVEITELRKPDD
ncbi:MULTISPECIES: hypothetical protein [Halorussus]|uniref:hypothetical protein n=1 Tax=Halorussus TaxID=1070314 RepID=UPI00209E36A5|nr:hypothetical protein [Halorussus vallis]USZ78262.1 hypothetical protein NGM07_23285 [Halorussus vallis]